MRVRGLSTASGCQNQPGNSYFLDLTSKSGEKKADHGCPKPNQGQFHWLFKDSWHSEVWTETKWRYLEMMVVSFKSGICLPAICSEPNQIFNLAVLNIKILSHSLFPQPRLQLLWLLVRALHAVTSLILYPSVTDHNWLKS